MDPVEPREVKRIRQACANCRRKKIKCTGQRPMCFYCHRNRHVCVYEPYSTTLSERKDTPATKDLRTTSQGGGPDIELLRRLSTIETRLADLDRLGQAYTGHPPSPHGQPSNTLDFAQALGPLPQECLPASPNSYDNPTLPPSPVLQSVIEAYFEHVHNQPYSYFHEPSFRARLEQNLIPRCLVLAILASAVRFSNHNFYVGKIKEATSAYAKESWALVLTEYLTTEENINVNVVQTVSLLAIVDYTAGQVSSGWLKTGVAARISQDLNMTCEPDIWLSPIEQEERRRAFWSTYLVDKLISCSRGKPVAIHDEDCNVQLPCDEKSFLDNEWKLTQHLSQLLSWEGEHEPPSPFALAIVATSIFSRCSRYTHQNRIPNDHPPWDSKSSFSKISALLLLMESYSTISNNSLEQGLCRSPQEAGHYIFAQAIVHLCNCLLYHPFILRLTLRRFGPKSPPSFVPKVIRYAREHAKVLIDVLWNASESGLRVESSFYAYCVIVAGGIHSLAIHSEDQSAQLDNEKTLSYFQRSTDILERLSRYWDHAGKMLVRLNHFHTQCYQYSGDLDQSSIPDLSPIVEEDMWAMVDYGTLSAVAPTESVLFPPTPPQIPCANTWLLHSTGVSKPENISHHQGGGSPNTEYLMRLNGVESFLDFADADHVP